MDENKIARVASRLEASMESAFRSGIESQVKELLRRPNFKLYVIVDVKYNGEQFTISGTYNAVAGWLSDRWDDDEAVGAKWEVVGFTDNRNDSRKRGVEV
jgi:hypothetical protein